MLLYFNSIHLYSYINFNAFIKVPPIELDVSSFFLTHESILSLKKTHQPLQAQEIVPVLLPNIYLCPMRNLSLFFICILSNILTQAQDTTVMVGSKIITLSNVVINNKLNIQGFIEKIKKDTSFYKAFKNLRTIGFTATNDIRMLGKNDVVAASLFSHTVQLITNNCRTMQTVDEISTGNMYAVDSSYNYYTASMYASLFFTKGIICGETNIVKDKSFTTDGKKGMEKHKEQLKMLFFNPGKRINGLPFISNKTAIYDDDIADSYDIEIDWQPYNNRNCNVFKQKVKPGKQGTVVVDEMTTWFDDKTDEVVARNYTLSYSAGVYDFKVTMDIQMTTFGNLTVPYIIKYNGDWKALFKAREKGIFTAILSNFKL